MVLKVVTGKLQTEMVCTVIGESNKAIRIRIADICEIEIYKEMILSVARAWPTLTPTQRIVEEPLPVLSSEKLATLEI